MPELSIIERDDTVTFIHRNMEESVNKRYLDHMLANFCAQNRARSGDFAMINGSVYYVVTIERKHSKCIRICDMKPANSGGRCSICYFFVLVW